MKLVICILFSASLFYGQAQVKGHRAIDPAPSLASLSMLADGGSITSSVGSIILSATAQDAVKAGQAWENEHVAPSTGADGRVLYRYGSGLPTIVCAPLRVCTMELQPGEHIQGDPQIGDAVRWDMSLSLFGTGEQTAIVVLKPQQSGLDTNLLITTDRRAYYVRLISQPDAYIARVGFSYPEDDSSKWREKVAATEPVVVTPIGYTKGVSPLLAPELFHFNYTCKGGNENMRPLRVFDDGAKTYLQMPAAMLNREAPVLMIIGPDKKEETIIPRLKEQTYIVDRLFDHARLQIGTGKHAQKVEITHG